MPLAATLEKLRAHVPGEHAKSEPLANRTSIRIGGKADLFVQPADADALVQTLKILADDGLPWHVLGGGANSLVGDGGIRGAVLRLPNLPEQIETGAEGVTVTLAAGSPIAKIIQLMRKHRTVGAEFMAGIPGTVGGAVTMNAGTQNGSLERVLRRVELATPDGFITRERDALRFAYRFTHLPERSVVARATLFLPYGQVELSEKKIADDLAYRRSTQPLQLPNFGSCFVNPAQGSAGRLIEGAGLKGHRIGNAQISPVHANFIVNLGGATASEVRALLDLAQSRVREQTGIVLRREVKFVGEF
jgi:UDP-N-acetylmuramate dehydrogenase